MRGAHNEWYHRAYVLQKSTGVADTSMQSGTLYKSAPNFSGTAVERRRSRGIENGKVLSFRYWNESHGKAWRT